MEIIFGRQAVWVALTLAPMLWGGNFVVGSLLAVDLPGHVTNWLRWLIALGVLIPFCASGVWHNWAVLLLHWRQLGLMALLGVALFNTLLYAALQSTSLSIAAVAFAVTPFMTTAIVALIRREAPEIRLMIAAAIALFGMILAQWHALNAGSPAIGIALMLLAALVWSGYCITLKEFALPVPDHVAFFAQVLLGVLIMSPVALLTIPLDMLVLGGAQWVALGYLGVFAAALAFWLWHYGVSRVGPAKANLFLNIVPLSSLVLGELFLGLQISTVELAGLGLVFLGILLSIQPPE